MMLDNKIAAITGAGRGIGKGIALEFAKEGADIVITDINLEEAKQVAEEVKALGRKAIAIKVDVSSKNDVDSMMAEIIKEFGRLDIMVSNAGISKMISPFDITEKAWETMINVNLMGAIMVSQAAGKIMSEQGNGNILFTISLAGKCPSPDEAHYSASKCGLMAYMQSFAQEMIMYGVRVNGVCPGLVETSMNVRENQWLAELRADGSTAEDVKNDTLGFIPMGRLGTPEDVAKVMVFLASDMSAYMTGQALNITGGMANIK
jgi:NAD(P)-dependent dehydrogenase (short-subunit alcohol dehydrogenase family)